MAREDALNPTMMKNLAALNRTQPEMLGRLCEPSSDDHISGIPAHLTVNRSTYPIALSSSDLNTILEESVEGSVLVFGVGIGDFLIAILKANPKASVVAWDRDPSMIRLALASHDFAEWMNDGRLMWSLAEDIFDLQHDPTDHLFEHPLLSQVYRHERAILDMIPDSPRVLMCAGGLFIDDVADCFEKSGMAVFTWDVSRQSEASLAMTARRVKPEFVFSINYTHGLAEACHELGVPLLVWEIDPTTDGLRPVGCPTGHVQIHTYRAANVDRFRAAGFRQVTYTPLAANTERRTPGRGERNGPPVCFVGASMVAQAMEFRGIFIKAWSRVYPDNPSAKKQAIRLLDGILAEQRLRPRDYVVPGLMRRHMSDFVAAAEGTLAHDAVALVAEIAAAERRLNVAAQLGSDGLHVWGDPGWKAAESHGVTYRGFAGHRRQLTDIYRNGHIHIDINRLYQLDIVPMRVFDVLACGGFLIAEYSPALADLFDIGVEIEAWKTVDELVSKVRYYRDHPEEAHLIARRGHQAVNNRHSIAERLLGMLRGLPQFTGASAVG